MPKDIHRRVVFERGKPENTQMSTRKGSFKSDIIPHSGTLRFLQKATWITWSYMVIGD